MTSAARSGPIECVFDYCLQIAKFKVLMPGIENDARVRLDNAIFGNFGRKLVENPQ